MTYDAVEYERDSEGAFYQAVAGSKRSPWSFSASYSTSDTSITRSHSTLARCGLPTNLSSLTIVDITGSAVSRRLAHALLERAKEYPSVRFAEVRIGANSSA